eukprot:COSAG05_NODE_250_length_12887_cov_28.030810_2_plen_46_part_00
MLVVLGTVSLRLMLFSEVDVYSFYFSRRHTLCDEISQKGQSTSLE